MRVREGEENEREGVEREREGVGRERVRRVRGDGRSG